MITVNLYPKILIRTNNFAPHGLAVGDCSFIIWEMFPTVKQLLEVVGRFDVNIGLDLLELDFESYV